MTYRVRYQDGWAPAIGLRAEQSCERSEYFLTKDAALRRAEEVLRAGVHHHVSVIDGADNVLCGILLELRLGTR
jgi:hypothetical protein